MTLAVQRLLDEAMKLSPEERATLARGLLASLPSVPEGTTEEIERAWGEETRRRLALLEAGLVQTTPWEAARARLRDELGA